MTEAVSRVRSVSLPVLFRKLRWAALAVVLTAPGCRRNSPSSIPTFLGDDRRSEVDASSLDPALADAWTRLQAAWEDAPESERVPTIADEILEQNPPPELAREALHAKSAHAYLHGQDVDAAALAERGLSWEPKADKPGDLERSLTQLRLRALARGGDPQVALQELDDPQWIAQAGLESGALAGIRAVALERDASFGPALTAYTLWRASVTDDSAAALYADTRIVALGRTLPKAAIEEEAAGLEPGPARRCLEALAGGARPAADEAKWVQACAGPPARVGVLLPRTGPLSAFADAQLAAASVSAVSLSEASVGGFLWRDAGSSKSSAASGARALVEEGATVIVGPIGASNVRAVHNAVGDQVAVVVPGESVGGAMGVAPSLETRIDGLVRLARDRGARQIMVLTPDNGYGRRALKAIERSVGKKAKDDLVVQTYPVDTTSFQPLLAPLLGGLRAGGAVIVPDHVTRLESVVRQLIRLDRAPSADGSEGVMVLSTAEGASQTGLIDDRKVLSEVWIAPVAWASEGTADFEQAFLDAEGHPPGDQELLVFRAFERALAFSAEGPPTVTLAHVGPDGVIRTATQ
ncbi:MAG: ABC transporter substrate-binding protein [Nannocystales bacterium]